MVDYSNKKYLALVSTNKSGKLLAGYSHCYNTCQNEAVINYLLPESLLFTRARILFLVSLLYIALVNHCDPYSP